MTWASVAIGVGSLVGGGLSLLGSSNSASAASNASQAQVQAAQLAQQTQLGIYNQTRNDLAPYNFTGQNASNALAQFMGLPSSPVTAGLLFSAGGGLGGAANADSATTLNNIKQGLQQWNQAVPGNAQPIIDMINNGANLQQVQSALRSLATTTTNPQNTAFLNPLIQQANNPVMQPLGGFGGTGGAAGGGTANAFNPSAILQNWPGYQFMRDQGQLGIARQNTAGGRFLSGAQMKDAMQFGSNYALAGAVQPYMAGLQNLSALGENAGGLVGNAGVQTGSGVASSIMSGGTAAASGFAGSANAFNQGLTGVSTAIQGALNSQAFQGAFNNNNMMQGGSFASGAGIFPNIFITGPQ